jgi:hypothetical protein
MTDECAKVEFTTKPFHVVFRKLDGTIQSVLGDLFPDGQIDWVHLENINNQEDCLVCCWDYERKKWVSFYKSKVLAFVELQ